MEILRAQNTGRPGETIAISTLDGTIVQAKAGNEINSGKVLAITDEQGQITVFSPSSGQEINRSQRIRRRRPTVKSKTVYPIKILFSIEEEGLVKFFVGGDRVKPEQIYQIPVEAELLNAVLNNIGEKKSDWIATIHYSVEDNELDTIYYIVNLKPSEDGIEEHKFSSDRYLYNLSRKHEYAYLYPKGNGALTPSVRELYEYGDGKFWLGNVPNSPFPISSNVEITNRNLATNYYQTGTNSAAIRQIIQYCYWPLELNGSNPNTTNLVGAITKPPASELILQDFSEFRTFFNPFSSGDFWTKVTSGNLNSFQHVQVPYYWYLYFNSGALPGNYWRANFYPIIPNQIRDYSYLQPATSPDDNTQRNIINCRRLNQLDVQSLFGDYAITDHAIYSSIHRGLRGEIQTYNRAKPGDWFMFGIKSDRTFNPFWIDFDAQRDRAIPNYFTYFQILLDINKNGAVSGSDFEYNDIFLQTELPKGNLIELVPNIERNIDFRLINIGRLRADIYEVKRKGAVTEIEAFESKENFIRYELILDPNNEETPFQDKYYWVNNGEELELDISAFSNNEIIIPTIRTFLKYSPYYSTLKGNKIYHVSMFEKEKASVKVRKTKFETTQYTINTEGVIIQGKTEKFEAIALKTIEGAEVHSVSFFPINSQNVQRP